MRSRLTLVGLMAIGATEVGALTLNITYDASTSSAPAGFFTAFNYAAALYENAFNDPVTIHLQVGWGRINGSELSPGNRAQTANFQLPFNFNQVRDALSRDSRSASDATAVASLPATDPTGAATTWVMSRAEAKALGLLAGDDKNIHPSTGLSRPDGYIGFMNDAASYTFDPSNRSVPGKYDFIGIASHEITELMGRYGQGQTLPGAYSPLDLFRYRGPGARDLALATSGAFFSINGGTTAINTFRGKLGGDPSDWLGSTADSYNAVADPGQLLTISSGDLLVMDAIGYDPAPLALQIQIAAGNLLISWPAMAQDYLLETAANLELGAHWRPVTNAPALVGLRKQVAIPNPGGKSFYRLKK